MRKQRQISRESSGISERLIPAWTVLTIAYGFDSALDNMGSSISNSHLVSYRRICYTNAPLGIIWRNLLIRVSATIYLSDACFCHSGLSSRASSHLSDSYRNSNLVVVSFPFYGILVQSDTSLRSMWIVLTILLCGNYGNAPHISCGGKDFLGTFYVSMPDIDGTHQKSLMYNRQYPYAMQTVAMFGLGLQRFPAMLGALTFFLLWIDHHSHSYTQSETLLAAQSPWYHWRPHGQDVFYHSL